MLRTEIYKIDTDNQLNSDVVIQEGACKNQLLIMVQSDDLNEDTRKTLSNILNSIKYNLEDSCMIVLQESQSISINPYIHKHKIDKVLSFGIPSKDLGLQIAVAAYRLITMEEMKLVFSHTITELNKDKQKKIALWNAIQNL